VCYKISIIAYVVCFDMLLFLLNYNNIYNELSLLRVLTMILMFVSRYELTSS